MKIKINWAGEGPLWTIEKETKKESDTELEVLLAGHPNLAAQNYQINTFDPFEAVRRIGFIRKEISASRAGFSLAPKAYAFALNAQIKILLALNQNPNLTSRVYFDDVSGLPSFSNMAADLISYCGRFEPEPILKAVLDSFSGWAVLGVQKFEGCRCSGEPVNLELKMRVHHSHEIKDGKFFIEQLLGIESENKEHLERHYNKFSQKSKTGENIVIVAVSKASIKLVGEYGDGWHEFAVEEEKHSDEIDINAWRLFLDRLSVKDSVEAEMASE